MFLAADDWAATANLDGSDWAVSATSVFGEVGKSFTSVRTI